ncbi:DUF3570 domain-containing protein [Fluviicola sp.]|uniref:DUF3570 domain-containing protein n=1 Tax=Fluviicola sp. TaxID=1917219 RepID=UPI0031D7AD2C
MELILFINNLFIPANLVYGFLLSGIFLIASAFRLFAQDKPTTKVHRPTKLDLTSSYYGQTGEHSAIDGGIGSQKLNSFTQELSVYVPVKSKSGFTLSGGVDHYTSASLLRIDKYPTAASSGVSGVSGDETRSYATIAIDFANLKHKWLISPYIGFSTEYDVNSFNSGLSWSKELFKVNPDTKQVNKVGNYKLSLGFTRDRWMVVRPGEFRNVVYGKNLIPVTGTYNSGASGTTGNGNGGVYESGASASGSGSGSGSGNGSGGSSSTGSGGSETGSGSGGEYTYTYYVPDSVDRVINDGYSGKMITKDGKQYPQDWRYSINLNNGVDLIINRKTIIATGVDAVLQLGLLSTSFHRVYFNDGVSDEFYKEVRIENLPRQRFKLIPYFRMNHYVNKNIVLRGYVRTYFDTWGINALTVQVEPAFTLGRHVVFSPDYRFHIQSKSVYFKGYGEHELTDRYYTSDYDLSGLNAHRIGASLRFTNLDDFLKIQNETKDKAVVRLPTFALRYGYYKRSDGLEFHSITGVISFEF